MIGENDQITKGQSNAITYTTILGVGILSLPGFLVLQVGTAGWMLIPIGAFLASIMLWVVSKLSKKFPGETISDYGRKLVPKPLADLFSIIFFIYFIITMSIIIRIFGEVVKMFLLTNTPTEVIIMSMLLTTTYLVRKGIEPIARMLQILIPIVLVPILFLIISLMPELDWSNVMPLFKVDFMVLIKSIPAIFFSFLGFEALFFTMSFVRYPKGTYIFNFVAVWGIAFSYLLIYFVALAQFGPVEITHLLWPTLSLMKTLSIPGAFLENVEGVVMALWVLVVLGNTSTTYFIEALILTKLTGVKEHKFFVLPILPVIYVLALIPDNIAQVYDYLNQVTNIVGSFTVLGIPILYLVLSLFKKNKQQGVSKNG